MAAATAVFTLTKHWIESKAQYVIGTLAITASPATYTTGGIALNVQNPLIKEASLPVWHEVVAESASGDPQYTYAIITLGLTQSTLLLKIFSAGVELTNASAIPAGVSGDTLIKILLIFFPKFV
jgi:hypothetical protein